MEFNLVDILIFILILIFMLKGYNRGLIKQITVIAAVALGLYVAAEQYNVLSVFLMDKFQLNNKIAEATSFVIIVISVSLFINYLGYIFSQMADFLFLSIFNSLGGALFGLVKAGLISYILLLIISNIPISFAQKQLESSYLAPKILALSPILKEKIAQLTE